MYRSVFALINMGEERIVPVVPELSSCNHLSVVRGHHVYKEFWVPVVANEVKKINRNHNRTCCILSCTPLRYQK
ncbi:hypothetical protein EMCRGX_G013892 [Ephydatia muelleri]